MLTDGTSSEKSYARCMVEAAAWSVHLTETDGAHVVAFEAWLAADTRHRAAWDQVQAPWRLIDGALASPEAIKLRREVLNRTYARFCERRQPWQSWLSRLSPGRWPVLGVGCAILLAAMSVLWWNRAEVYETGPGERLSIVLTDGSRVPVSRSQLSRLKRLLGPTR